MSSMEADVAVIGSGFAGSLISLILDRIGLSTVLIERGSHPRFAIGESSTPIANRVLRDLALRYDLPQLSPLANYSAAKTAYPNVTMGIKRGFSYFAHAKGQPFVAKAKHRNELLAAANSDDLHADTHWLRSDVDHFFVDQVQSAKIPFLDHTKITQVKNDGPWTLACERSGNAFQIKAQFVIDASGQSGFLTDRSPQSSNSPRLLTNTRAIYGHFRGVESWRDCFANNGGNVLDHPFRCDNAAVHHLLEDAWMWQLRFRGGVTSVGIVIDNDRHPVDLSVEPETEWQQWIQAYPSIANQLSEARIANPPNAILRSGRLQRSCDNVCGNGWAALPNAAGFIDPLHSTGIAQTLCGVERLAIALGHFADKDAFQYHLNQYEITVRREFQMIDQLVHGCYLAIDNFKVFSSYLMMYFAAATTYERHRHEAENKPGSAFLCADDENLRKAVSRVYDRLRNEPRQSVKTKEFAKSFEAEVASAIRPFNTVGLCDPAVQNMYRYTAAPV